MYVRVGGAGVMDLEVMEMDLLCIGDARRVGVGVDDLVEALITVCVCTGFCKGTGDVDCGAGDVDFDRDSEAGDVGRMVAKALSLFTSVRRFW